MATAKMIEKIVTVMLDKAIVVPRSLTADASDMTVKQSGPTDRSYKRFVMTINEHIPQTGPELV